MDPKMSLTRLTEAVARANAQAASGAVSAAPPFTIALSREAGANGSLVARAVGERLGWPVYDRELLERVAEQLGLRAPLLESVDEKRSSWLGECLQALSSAPGVSAAAYVRRLLETVVALAAQGKCVIVGRAAAQILPSATTLRVRLVGPLESRVAVVRKRLGLSQVEAARRVEAIDTGRVHFVKENFGRDPTDPARYDLVLNSVRFSVAACTDLIVEALRHLQTGVFAS
jgi:cytidylate kinase